MTTPQWPGFDDEIRAWMIEAPGAPPGSSPEVIRGYSRRNSALSFARARPSLTAASVVDQTVDGPDGPIPVRIFTPPAGAEPTPVVVYFHGGGWVIGDLDTHLAQAHRLCVEVGAVVVSVGYRLAPEHRFPAAFDDCLAVTEWAAANATALGGDPQLLVVAGDSAGGQLAASVAIACRDDGLPLAGQLLLYPVATVAGYYGDDDANAAFASRVQCGDGPGLLVTTMVWFAQTYADSAHAEDWRLSPMAATLTGLAPAVVHLAHFDMLRDEGNQYAEALREAGVPVIARKFPSLHHGYFGLGGVSAAADAAATLAAADLRDILGLPARPAV